VTKANQKLMGC